MKYYLLFICSILLSCVSRETDKRNVGLIFYNSDVSEGYHIKKGSNTIFSFSDTSKSTSCGFFFKLVVTDQSILNHDTLISTKSEAFYTVCLNTCRNSEVIYDYFGDIKFNKETSDCYKITFNVKARNENKVRIREMDLKKTIYFYEKE